MATTKIQIWNYILSYIFALLLSLSVTNTHSHTHASISLKCLECQDAVDVKTCQGWKPCVLCNLCQLNIRIIPKMIDLSHWMKCSIFKGANDEEVSLCVSLGVRVCAADGGECKIKLIQSNSSYCNNNAKHKNLCTQIKWKPTINLELVCYNVIPKEKTSSESFEAQN